MNLRLKLLLPLLVGVAAIGAYLYAIWMPRALAEAQSDHLVRVERHLDSVAEGLIPLLVSGQLDAIHENLAALKARNLDWKDIHLADRYGRQLYPLVSRAAPAPATMDSAQLVVIRPIVFLDSDLGTLKVLIDFSELHARDRAHHLEISVILGAITLTLLLILGLAVEVSIGRPINALMHASRELARGDYQAVLPGARRDEVGALIASFEAMRHDLRAHHDSLLHEIAARDAAQQEQLRLNAEVTDRENNLRAVTDAVQDAIIRIDERGIITFWNPGAEKLFGVATALAVGTPMHDRLAPPRYRARANNEYDRFVNTGDGPILGKMVELDALRADGQEFPIELTVSRVASPHGWHAVGVIRDISERKRNEAELIRHRDHLEELVTERTHELAEKNTSLESALSLVQRTQNELIDSEKMASLGRLVAGFAHEINTPIGVAVGASSHALEISKRIRPLLDHNEVDETVLRTHLDEIDEACRLTTNNLARAADLVGRFKRTSVDQTRGVVRLYNLKETLHDVVASLHDVVKRTPIRIEIACPDGINLYGYPGALGQIATNLIINSLNHGFAKGSQPGTIQIGAAREGKEIVIHFRDSGKGMDALTRSRLFEPFFTTARDSGGTGLGLFICHNLATAELKGSLRCEGETCQGTHFVLRYPATGAPTIH